MIARYDSDRQPIGRIVGKNSVIKTTRVPIRLHSYIKRLADRPWPQKRKAVKDFQMEILKAFSVEKPWITAGMAFRKTKSLSSVASADGESGWEQINLDFTGHPEILKEMEIIAAAENINLSRVLYTALFWWSWNIEPPAGEAARRRQLGMPESIPLSAAAERARLLVENQNDAARRSGSRRSRSATAAPAPTAEPVQPVAQPSPPAAKPSNATTKSASPGKPSKAVAKAPHPAAGTSEAARKPSPTAGKPAQQTVKPSKAATKTSKVTSKPAKPSGKKSGSTSKKSKVS